ncbi:MULTISPECIES: hypothetical protein [Mycolicibacter]|uniref:Alanine and proline rich membrane protein n=1 Tax=Mycolicibacter virginiensis TaxID=1795032 RepID=A0A9X7ILE6_9MYCO|nr:MULTISPECIES: hypothetical protein [Mycobacteriaceae]PQM51286.1 hypothetical protein C5U48_15550 [Mycolicibacter virginiensis]
MTITPPPWPAPSTARPNSRTAPGLAAIAALLAVAALIVGIVALTRPAPSPRYSDAQRNAAQAELCSTYKLASKAMNIATNVPDGDVAVARLSLTNGALMLLTAASDPALETKYRDAARALANAYQTQSAKGITATSEQYQKAMADTNSKTLVMIGLCGD